MRSAKRKAVGTEGADLTNVIFVTSFVQGDKLEVKSNQDVFQKDKETLQELNLAGVKLDFDKNNRAQCSSCGKVYERQGSNCVYRHEN